jgi:hypothetical protein
MREYGLKWPTERPNYRMIRGGAIVAITTQSWNITAVNATSEEMVFPYFMCNITGLDFERSPSQDQHLSITCGQDLDELTIEHGL